MTEDISSRNANEVNFRELYLYLKAFARYLRSKWLIVILVSLLGGIASYLYAYRLPVFYNATLTFALEEEKSGGGGLAGAVGLASSLGIDIGGGGAGGAFSGANLIELMKSRFVVERALLSPVTVNGTVKSFADYYWDIRDNEQKISGSHLVSFPPNSDRSTFSRQQDSILGRFYEEIAGAGGIFSVSQKDKKVSIITIETRSTNELFAKTFTESIAKEISEFYVDTKSKKAKLNLEILQRQTDSVRGELNRAITGVAAANDNTFNLNSAILLPKTVGTRRQIDVQANTAILTQLVTNLEMAKVALRKETPLIQVIDKPILPLSKSRTSKIKSFIVGAMVSFVIISFILLLYRESSKPKRVREHHFA